MSSAIQKVVQSARRTFSRKFERFVLDSDDFASSLCELKTLLEKCNDHKAKKIIDPKVHE